MSVPGAADRNRAASASYGPKKPPGRISTAPASMVSVFSVV
jgi:hypothetical protein